MSESEPMPATSALPQSDPLGLFDRWMAEARASEPNDSNAMALATATPDGRPSVRMVLLKGHGPDGFTFYIFIRAREPRSWVPSRRTSRVRSMTAPLS